MQMQTQAPRASLPKVEVAPGILEPLRPANEMYKAMETGNVIPTSCFVCSLELLSLDDAKYILCPDCRVVSPIHIEYDFGQNGVSLGVKKNKQRVAATTTTTTTPPSGVMMGAY